jgi:hypothetical protein
VFKKIKRLKKKIIETQQTSVIKKNLACNEPNEINLEKNIL